MLHTIAAMSGLRVAARDAPVDELREALAATGQRRGRAGDEHREGHGCGGRAVGGEDPRVESSVDPALEGVRDMARMAS